MTIYLDKVISLNIRHSTYKLTMAIKNRKFNVAGVSFHENNIYEDEVVYFELDTANQYDKNAVKVLNRNFQILGYVPRESSEEIHTFLNGKYSYYCAKVVNVWNPEDDTSLNVPKIMAHFSDNPSELPDKPQKLKSYSKKTPNTRTEQKFSYGLAFQLGKFISKHPYISFVLLSCLLYALFFI